MLRGRRLRLALAVIIGLCAAFAAHRLVLRHAHDVPVPGDEDRHPGPLF